MVATYVVNKSMMEALTYPSADTDINRILGLERGGRGGVGTGGVRRTERTHLNLSNEYIGSFPLISSYRWHIRCAWCGLAMYFKYTKYI